jgi:hypothetical protein
VWYTRVRKKRMEYLVRSEGRISHLDDVSLGEGLLQDGNMLCDVTLRYLRVTTFAVEKQ